MNFILGWELTEQRAAEYAREHGFDKENDIDDEDDDSEGEEEVTYFAVVHDIHSRADIPFLRVLTCWDADGNEGLVFVLFEQEANRLADVSYSPDDLPPQESIDTLRSLLNPADPSPKWYVHATQWPGYDWLREAFRTTGDDEERDSEGEETEVEDEHVKATPAKSAGVAETTSQMKELRI